MSDRSDRRVGMWLPLLAATSAGVVAATLAGSPATASTGGSAAARAANVLVSDLTVSASTSEPALQVFADDLDGVVIPVSGDHQSGEASTPAEPTGDEHDVGLAVQVPPVEPVVELSGLEASTTRTVDALEATSLASSVHVALPNLSILDTDAVQSGSTVTIDGAPSATASVASLEIRGVPFVVEPNVELNNAIDLDTNEVFALFGELLDIPDALEFGFKDGFGTIDVTVLSSTSMGAHSASAVGLDVVVHIHLHLVLGPGDPNDPGVVVLDVAGPLVSMTLAETSVTRPASDPPGTTLPDDCIAASGPGPAGVLSTTTSPDTTVFITTPPDAMLPDTLVPDATMPATTVAGPTAAPETTTDASRPVTTLAPDVSTSTIGSRPQQFRSAPAAPVDGPCDAPTTTVNGGGPTTINGGGSGGGGSLPGTGPATARAEVVTATVVTLLGLGLVVAVRSRVASR